jgi:hypothetical protein
MMTQPSVRVNLPFLSAHLVLNVKYMVRSVRILFT